MKDPEWREGAIQWAMNTYGATREEAENPTHLPEVHRYVRQYKQHLANERQERFDDYMQQRAKNAGVNWRNPPRGHKLFLTK